MALGRSPLDSPRRTPSWRRILWTLGICAGLSGFAADHALAGPGDDWSLEHSKSDPKLVSQRFVKLRKRPFDRSQWKALERAIGVKGLVKRIDSGLRSRPNDVALRVLRARAWIALGEAGKAATLLAEVEADAGRHKTATFNLRVRALQLAGDYRKAVAALEKRAAASRDATRTKLLERAYSLAHRGRLTDDALRFAEMLASAKGAGKKDSLRLARAAERAHRAELADRAYEKAASQARGAQRDEIAVERARARLSARNPGGAAALVWKLLEQPARGTHSRRERWWELLVSAHRRDGSAEILVARLTKWIEGKNEAGAWRALAAAQEAVGIDPVPAWRKAVASAPRNAESRAALIEALESAGKTKQAIEEYQALYARDPGAAQSGLELATRLIQNGERAAGMKLAGEIEASTGRRAHTLMLLLDFYNLNDEQDRALAVARRLAKAHPRNADARIALGEQLYQMNKVEEALKQWATLTKLVRPKHKGYARHAEILSEHGRSGDARTALRKALKLAPNQPRYLRLMAVLDEEQRRPERALNLWNLVRELADAPEHRLLRDEARTRVVELLVGGAINGRRQKLEREEAAARATLDRSQPLADSIEAGRFLAELYTRQEKYASAVGVQQQLLKLRPDDPDRLAELASAQRRAGQTQTAIDTLEELLVVDPSRSPDVLAELSELAFEAGDIDRALESAKRSARGAKSGTRALIRLGELHERKGDIDEAARAYQHALEVSPRDVRARLHLAELELTRGNLAASAEMFRGVLETGGPPELMREAGLRALDLAEASESTYELVELAIQRTRRDPDADEPREFLLEALERATSDEVARWLRGKNQKKRDPNRTAALRRPLVEALARGSVRARLRAAEHLGRLRLPETAVPLAKMGAQLSPPRDATRTVRQAFEEARATAIRAAGELDDPEAVEVFAGLLSQSTATNHAAAWALARSRSAKAAAALSPHVHTNADPLLASLGCIALTRHPEVGSKAAPRVSRLAHEAKNPNVRHACAYAEAALTPDDKLTRLHQQVQASDPVLASIAAWRLGLVDRRQLKPETIEALMRRFLGPKGLPRDAAGAALARLLGARERGHQAAKVPPPARGAGWSTVLERWLKGRIAPAYRPVTGKALAPFADQLKSAFAAAKAGTRAERVASAEALRSCGDRAKKPDPTAERGQPVCLAPLSEQTIYLPSASVDK